MGICNTALLNFSFVGSYDAEKDITKICCFSHFEKKKTKPKKTKDKSREERQKKLKGMENVSCHFMQELRLWKFSGDMK